jgi:hypothetical protein
VQDVEDAIREHDPLAARLRFGDECDELRHIDEPAATAALRVQCALQLRTTRRRRSDLADDNAGAEISERRGIGCREPRSDTGPEQRDDRVAGAGHVEHFLRVRRQRQRVGVLLEQRHALLTARHQQQIEIEVFA